MFPARVMPRPVGLDMWICRVARSADYRGLPQNFQIGDRGKGDDESVSVCLLAKDVVTYQNRRCGKGTPECSPSWCQLGAKTTLGWASQNNGKGN